jgi:hypothetical protein
VYFYAAKCRVSGMYLEILGRVKGFWKIILANWSKSRLAPLHTDIWVELGVSFC